MAEQSAGFSTKQILGFMWPIALLKKNGKDVPKGKLQSIQHMGKTVKGMILEEWTLGASNQIIFGGIGIRYSVDLFIYYYISILYHNHIVI